MQPQKQQQGQLQQGIKHTYPLLIIFLLIHVLISLVSSDQSSQELYFMQLGSSDTFDIEIPEPTADNVIPQDRIGITYLAFIAPPNNISHATLSISYPLNSNSTFYYSSSSSSPESFIKSSRPTHAFLLNPQQLDLQELTLIYQQRHSAHFDFSENDLSQDIMIKLTQRIEDEHGIITSQYLPATNSLRITKSFMQDFKQNAKQMNVRAVLREIQLSFYNQIRGQQVQISISVKNVNAFTFDLEILIENCFNICSLDLLRVSIYSEQSITSTEQEGGQLATRILTTSCHISCETCTGPNPNECMSCLSGNYLLNSVCHSSPPPNAYCDTDNICTSCPQNCTNCSTDPNICTACSGYKYGNTCSVSKLAYSYCDAMNVCEPCLENCEDCENGVTTCTQCKGGLFFYQDLCHLTVPDGSFCGLLDYCFPCSNGCLACSAADDCSNCYENFYLYGKACQTGILVKHYCDATIRVCSACDTPCETCDATLTTCLTCNGSAPYLFNSTCQSGKPEKAYCESSVDNGVTLYTCTACPLKCGTCTKELTCLSCALDQGVSYYFYESDCVEEVPEGVVCDKSTMICKKEEGIKCEVPCETCKGGTKAENCIICASGFVKYNGKCICEDKRQLFNEVESVCAWKTGGLNAETLDAVNSAFSGASIATSAMAVVFAASSGFTKSGGGILSKYNLFNVLALISSDATELQMDFEYKETGITTGLMKNAGGAITVQIVLLLLQGVFVIVIKNSKDSKAYSVYRNCVCGIMLQMLPLVMFVIFDSLCVELSQINNHFNSSQQSIAEQIVLLGFIVFCFLDVIAILWFLACQHLREATSIDEQAKTEEQQRTSVVMEVVKEISKRDTIQEKDSSKRYLLVYFAFECVLYPLVSVFCRSDFVTALLLLLACQLCEFSYTIIVRPFYIKNTNVLYILEQGLQVCIYASFLVLAYLLDGLPLENDLSGGIVIFSLLSSSFCLLGIFVNPIIQILLIITAVKGVLEMRKREKMILNAYVSESSVSQFTTIELNKLHRIMYPFKQLDLKSSQVYQTE